MTYKNWAKTNKLHLPCFE